MEWLTHLGSLFGGAIGAGVPLYIWFASQMNRIRAEARKTDQEFDARQQDIDAKDRGEAYMELKRALEDVKKLAAEEREECRRDIGALDKRVVELQQENLECAKKSAKQDIEIYRQAGIIQFLETRVKALETSVTSPQAPPSAPGQVIAAAVKDITKETVAEANAAASGT